MFDLVIRIILDAQFWIVIVLFSNESLQYYVKTMWLVIILFQICVCNRFASFWISIS